MQWQTAMEERLPFVGRLLDGDPLKAAQAFSTAQSDRDKFAHLLAFKCGTGEKSQGSDRA
jgi:hypothetical protein